MQVVCQISTSITNQSTSQSQRVDCLPQVSPVVTLRYPDIDQDSITRAYEGWL
jgi:hypothetical protein